jgi:uncharacterized membrane protein
MRQGVLGLRPFVIPEIWYLLSFREFQLVGNVLDSVQSLHVGVKEDTLFFNLNPT